MIAISSSTERWQLPQNCKRIAELALSTVFSMIVHRQSLRPEGQICSACASLYSEKTRSLSAGIIDTDLDAAIEGIERR